MFKELRYILTNTKELKNKDQKIRIEIESALTDCLLYHLGFIKIRNTFIRTGSYSFLDLNHISIDYNRIQRIY
jgi:hypothetical protein